jgi:hypothetical protein
METTVDADVLGVPVSTYAMNESRVLIVFFSKGKVRGNFFCRHFRYTVS